ncbi:MAG TPA: hypothetical protein VJ045_06140 [Hyphomicrobiaceae bacterium]|nr:hypothetical protein [Hyphomicrobiaceae bacterium]
MNDVSPTHQITDRAIKAIGGDNPNADYILRPEEHARLLPPEAAPLARILLRHKQIQEEFRMHDALANKAQARYKFVGRWILISSLIGLLLGATFLLPPLQNAPPPLRTAATIIEYLSLFAAFFLARYLAVARPFPQWMRERARAELARVKLFDVVLDSEEQVRDEELPLLPLKLEYFRRYQLDVQRRYYGRRGKQHQQAAGHTKTWERASLTLSVISILIALWVGLVLFPYFGVTLPWPPLQSVVNFAVALPFDDERWLFALGVAGAAFYGYATSRSLMNLDERNASRYLTTHANLEFIVEKILEPARQHAARGDEADVREFVRRVQDLISSEHKEWVDLQETLGGRLALGS